MIKAPSVSFTTCALAALALIAGITALDVATGSIYSVGSEFRYRGAMFVFGLLPVIVFFTALFFRLRDGGRIPSDAEIDSIYYLGFLITLFTLIATVLSSSYAALQRSSSFGQETTLLSVSSGFVLSLAATALSLFFRITLAAKKEHLVLDSSLDDLEARVSRMIRQADRAYSELLVSIEASLQKFQEFSLAQRAGLETDFRDSMHAFRAELHGIIGAFSDEITNSGLSESLQSVTASFRKGGGELADIIKSLGPIPNRVTLISSRLDDVASEADAAHRGLADVGSRLHATVLKLDALPAEPLRASLLQFENHLKALDDVMRQAGDLVSAGSFDAATSLTKTTDDLRQVSDDLGSAFVRLSSELANSANVLARNLRGDFVS